MKLCGGKEESSLVCHCNHRRLGSANFNERLIILPSFCLNLLIVPYVKVPLLISLLVCLCCLSSTSEEATYKPYASLNWNCNEFPSLAKCAFFPRSFSLFLCALFCTIRRRQVGNVSKLPCHVLLMATLTATFLLSATISVRPVSAQSLALLTTDSTDSYEHEEDEDSEQTAYPTIIRLKNDTVSLPCNISQSKEEENSIKLILWYKNNILGTPIYSIDARDTNISQARHFVAPSYQGRATFELNLAARLALLVVRPLAAEDEGHYICRVDFRWTRTTVSTVKLDVIVPPERLRVIQVKQSAGNGSNFEDGSDGKWAKERGSVATREGDNGGEMHGRPHEHPVLGTSLLSILYNGLMINEVETVRQAEETELTLFCDSIGGRPRSIVKWYRLTDWENKTDMGSEQLYAEVQSKEESALQLIDDSFQQLNQSEPQLGNTQMAVNWRKKNSQIDRATGFASFAVTNGNEPQWTAFVRNELHLGTVEDANHGQLYLCRTSNSNLSKPLDAIVRLEIYTRPKSIQIRQKLPPKDFLLSSSQQSGSSSERVSHLDSGSDGGGSNSHDENGHLVGNRTLHSIELLDYYLNAKQALMNQPFRLRSGFETDFICRSSGSRPPARILWTISYPHAVLPKDLTQLSSSYFNGKDSLSLLHFVPKFTDNKVSLTCRACNEALAESGACLRTDSNSSHRNGHHREYGHGANKNQTIRLAAPFYLETTVILDVNYKPIVSVKVLNGEQMYHEAAQSKTKQTSEHKIKQLKTALSGAEREIASGRNYHQFLEMQEIFFNCSINANPQAHLVHWFFNGKTLQTDLSKGVIITNFNRTMIISSALRSNSGYFHCTAANLLGETESERHQVDVLFEPQCRVNYMQTSYHHLGDIVQLKCQVLANPAKNLQFTWQFNGTSLSEHNANRSAAGEEEQFSSLEAAPRNSTSKLASTGDKWRLKANLLATSRTATHSSSQQLHLITNVIRIELNKWSTFGHFSCHSRNSVGQQKEGCKWHILPSHYQPQSADKHLKGGGGDGQSGTPAHHHRYHHRHHQQQSLSSHHEHFASSGTLNNCQIIESSNAVVIKCLEGKDQREDDAHEKGSQDFLAQVGNDASTGQSALQPPISATIDRDSSSDTATIYDDAQLTRVNHAEIPTRLTYHVQVFELTDAFAKLNSTDLTSKSTQSNEAEQHYFPQIDQPEPGKRVSSKSPTSSPPSLSDVPAPVLVMDTINFTNPLFIITNLSASTNYLLKIWSSKAHLDTTFEQVNITVRTQASPHQHHPPNSNTLMTLMQMSSQKLMLLVALVAFICAIFVALIVISAVFKIRAILEIRKARRAVNVNESISALETALCEMRPEMLENDLKSKNHFSMDTYRPYISVENVAEECIMVASKGKSSSSTLNHNYADSSLITYPNYLYPSTIAHKSGLKLNCSDEESVSTSNTSASNKTNTNTTESTNANSNYTHESKDKLELHLDEHCFPPPVDSSMLFCMDHHQLTPTSNSSHAFLVPEYHSYPLQLHILPEAQESMTSSVTVVSTPNGERCAYLPASTSLNNSSIHLAQSVCSGEKSSPGDPCTPKSMQTTV